MVVFIFEIIVQIVGQPGYIWGFTFWCDVVGLVSIVADLCIYTNYIFTLDCFNQLAINRATQRNRTQSCKLAKSNHAIPLSMRPLHFLTRSATLIQRYK